MEYLTEETKLSINAMADRRFGKNKSKYKVGQIIDNKMEIDSDSHTAFQVLSVTKDSRTRKTLYTIRDINSGKVFENLDSQRVGEVVNRSRKIVFRRKVQVPINGRHMYLDELERRLGMKKDTLVKYFNRNIMSIEEIRDTIRELEKMYREKIRINNSCR